MRAIGAFFRWLWETARIGSLFGAAGSGLRPGSGAAQLYTFLFLVFFIIGLVLVVLGFDLAKVDIWLDSKAGWFDWIGTIVFKIVLAVILLGCVLTFGAGATQHAAALTGRARRGRIDEAQMDRPRGTQVDAGGEAGDGRVGCGMMLLVLVVGYFCWVGIVNKI